MTDFKKILDKAKEFETKMKESQQKIKDIKVEGTSGSNLIKVILVIVILFGTVLRALFDLGLVSFDFITLIGI